MAKTKNTAPLWVRNLRTLMEQQGFNPRSLSLTAGLNATAVRDMLEGRTKFPRYDTARALAGALNTTPAALMGDADITGDAGFKAAGFDEDLELLTEIIARLQEVIEENGRRLPPRDFAAMAAAIYRRMQEGDARKKSLGAIGPKIHDLLDYELMRQKARG
jgi:transcriptional regulator with XRE-family HTH domain